jgi:hypothetical protein
MRLAASTGFEPVIFCVTGRRGQPDSPNSPWRRVYTFLRMPASSGLSKWRGRRPMKGQVDCNGLSLRMLTCAEQF